jgi:hypothetical protein
MERLENGSIQDKNIVPESFPVVSQEDTEMWFDTQTDEGLPENKIVFYIRFVPSNEKLRGYKLLRRIGKHEYVIRCSERFAGDFSLDFKTKSHEYSRTNLNRNEAEELGETIRSFVTSLRSFGIDSFSVSPATHAYSVEEVDDYKAEIIKNFTPELERYMDVRSIEEAQGDFLDKLLPHEVFDLHNELSGSNSERPGNGKSLARARSRLFKNYIETNFPDWKIDETYSPGSADFRIMLNKEE